MLLCVKVAPQKLKNYQFQSPARILKIRKVRTSSSSVVPVQPSTLPSTTSSLSDVVETDNRIR